MKLEILKMFLDETFVDISKDALQIRITTKYNTITHIGFVTYDIEKLCLDYNYKVETSHSTPLFDDCFNSEDNKVCICEIYDEYGFVIIHIEMYYH